MLNVPASLAPKVTMLAPMWT